MANINHAPFELYPEEIILRTRGDTQEHLDLKEN